MNPQPVENLELRAIEQRNQIHHTTTELKEKLVTARQKLDLSANLRHHFVPASVIVSCLALIVGYGVGGTFLHR